MNNLGASENPEAMKPGVHVDKGWGEDERLNWKRRHALKPGRDPMAGTDLLFASRDAWFRVPSAPFHAEAA